MKDAIRYTVSVKAIIQRKEIAGKEWKALTADPKSECAYTPEIEKVVQRTEEIFQQTVDQLDMAKLVAVVNQLGEDKVTGT